MLQSAENVYTGGELTKEGVHRRRRADLARVLQCAECELVVKNSVGVSDLT